VTRYDAVFLDLACRMPMMHMLNELRSGSVAKIPAIIVSPRGGLEDRVDGLNAGAGDDIVKPVELTELEARLRAVPRRPGPRPHAIYHYGDLNFESAAAGIRALDLTRLSVRSNSLCRSVYRSVAGPVICRTCCIQG
jgi:two-component system response regulator QseB